MYIREDCIIEYLKQIETKQEFINLFIETVMKARYSGGK